MRQRGQKKWTDSPTSLQNSFIVKYFNSMFRTGSLQPLLNMTLQLGVIVHIKRSIEFIYILWQGPLGQNIYFARFSIRSPDNVMYVLLTSCITKELVSVVN